MEDSPISNSPSGDPVATSGPNRSIVSMMIGVFTSPGQTFEDFCKKPSILIPLITVMVMAAVSGALTVKQESRIGYDIVKTSTVIPSAELERMRQESLNTGPVKGAINSALVVLIFGLIGALFVWPLGSYVFGGQAKFKAVWAVGLMGGLIPMVGGLLKVPLMLAKDSPYVSYGLAALMPGKDFTSILYVLFSVLDFFVIWAVIVLGIGCATVFNLSRGRGHMVAVIPVVMGVCLLVGALLFGLPFIGVEVTFL